MSSILKKSIRIYRYLLLWNIKNFYWPRFKEVKINSKIIVPNHFEPLEYKKYKNKLCL